MYGVATKQLVNVVISSSTIAFTMPAQLTSSNTTYSANDLAVWTHQVATGEQQTSVSASESGSVPLATFTTSGSVPWGSSIAAGSMVIIDSCSVGGYNSSSLPGGINVIVSGGGASSTITALLPSLSLASATGCRVTLADGETQNDGGNTVDLVCPNGTGTVDAAVTNVSVTCSTTTYSIGGTLSGLTGGTVVLQDNGTDNLSLNANGKFTFATKLAAGSTYAVSVLSQPSGQLCTVSSGNGTANANVTTVGVNCVVSSGNAINQDFFGSSFNFFRSNNAFSFVVGGGLDYAVTRHIAIRGQADLLYAKFTPIGGGDPGASYIRNRNVARLSTGVVFRF